MDCNYISGFLPIHIPCNDQENLFLYKHIYLSLNSKLQFTNTFTNTLDSELFQTARLSASSLRYYGLGLENGNYTVSLQFAKIAFVNS